VSLAGVLREPLRPSELVLHPSTRSLRSRWILRSERRRSTVMGLASGGTRRTRERGMFPGSSASTEPAWNDQNLRELTQAIESPLFFSHVRAAAGPPIQQTNCHPFPVPELAVHAQRCPRRVRLGSSAT
jgi:glutamine amidotransferase